VINVGCPVMYSQENDIFCFISLHVLTISTGIFHIFFGPTFRGKRTISSHAVACGMRGDDVLTLVDL